MPNTNQSSMPVTHAAAALPSVIVDSYNIEMRDDEGAFLGDRASNTAFLDIIDDWRDRLRRIDPDGDDPLGEADSQDLSKRKLDKLLIEGADPEAAGLVLGAVEDFANELATVIRRFLRAKGWHDTQKLVIGGGLRESRLGELAIGRTAVLLKAAAGLEIDLMPIRHHPDEAGLIGAAHLMPSWMFSGHDSLVAVDIGGTNIRAGIIALNLDKSPELAEARVFASAIWRHGDEEPAPTRDQAVDRLAKMLRDLIKRARKEGLTLAPFIGVGCPGVIEEDGAIARGGQNLPGGNWESSRFRLPAALTAAIPTVGDHETLVLIHNDAVVQGLSQIPFMRDVERWGVLTIGTGLGNARFTNRRTERTSRAGTRDAKARRQKAD